MKERKNRAKKIRGVKKVSLFYCFRFCGFMMTMHFSYIVASSISIQTKASDAAKGGKKK